MYTQVIKARLQQRDTGQARWQYRGTFDCIRKVDRTECLSLCQSLIHT